MNCMNHELYDAGGVSMLGRFHSQCLGWGDCSCLQNSILLYLTPFSGDFNLYLPLYSVNSYFVLFLTGVSHAVYPSSKP